MANLKDLIVNGAARIIGKTYSSEFVGDLTGNVAGNADTSSKLKTSVSLTTTDGTNTSTGVNFDGSAATSIKLPTTIKATFSGNLTGDVTGSVSGNAGTATKLKTARSLKITDDGTNTSTGVDFDGSGAVTLKLPSTIKASITGNVSGSSGSCTGNAATATTADKTAHSISVTDGASTPVAAINSWNGSANKTLTIKGDSPVTTSASTDTGTITIAHATSGVTAGTYRSVTVDTKGHVTGGTSPTTLEGYGITDAKIESGTITLGSNTVAPLTAESTLAASKVSGTLATINIPDIDASKITSGTLSVNRMPPHTHTSITDGTMTLYAHNSNEVNFGGTNNSGTIYFGYRAIDSKPIPSTFVFGGTGNGSATVKAGKVWGAVFNDLADAIPVGEGDVLEAGYCYGFDGEHYTRTSEYMQKSYIGIHSDTYGFKMGHEEGKEKLNVAVSGFVLAYVDKEYEVGTPLTCAEDGRLTEIELEDKIKYPERIVATYWKNEPNEEWGPEGKKVKVNGRRWVKVK